MNSFLEFLHRADYAGRLRFVLLVFWLPLIVAALSPLAVVGSAHLPAGSFVIVVLLLPPICLVTFVLRTTKVTATLPRASLDYDPSFLDLAEAESNYLSTDETEMELLRNIDEELSSLTVSLSKLSTEVREVGNLVRGRQILGSAEPKIKFDPQLPDKSITESALRKAIEEGRIDLYLQPIVSLPQRKVRYY